MIERRFIAVEQPLLPALAEALVATAPAAGRVDLRATVVVLPTSRACRRLRVALDRAADGRVLFAPMVCTPSMLLQQCVTPSRMIAAPLAEALSWQRVLRQADDTTCCELMGISRDHHRTVTASERQSLATRVQQVTAELAAACQTPADVSATIARLHLPGDREVWMSITALQQAMREDLDTAGLQDADQACAQAIAEGTIQLPGVTSLYSVAALPSPRERAVLTALAASGVSVTAIVHGDESLADRFHADGSIKTDVWASTALDTSCAAHYSCETTEDQAAVVLEVIAGKGECDAQDITLVTPDAAAAAPMHRACAQEQVHLHVPEYTDAVHTSVGNALVRLLPVLDAPTAQSWGEILRHPVLASHAPDDAAELWDKMWSQHLPRSLGDAAEDAVKKMNVALGDLPMLLRPLLSDTTAPACDWAAPISRVMQHLFGAARQVSPNDNRVLEMITSHLQTLHELPPDGLEVHAIDVMRAIVDRLAGQTLPSAGGGETIEVVGWLDAHLDDAATCIITGLNQGVLPAKPNTDPWAPDGLRMHLGLPTAATRRARDTWLMHALLHSGRDVHLVTPRTDMEGAPLMPSALLLGVTGIPLATRTLALLKSESGARLEHRHPACEDECLIENRPLPEGDPVIEHLRVTSFKSMLARPWEFIIEHDRRIRSREVHDRQDLNTPDFGSFVHDVLERWGEAESKHDAPTTDVGTIEHDLLVALQQETLERFGAHPMPGIKLQVEIAAHRLRTFAPHQALCAAAGWKVHRVELSFGKGTRQLTPPVLPAQGGLPLHGRIDRVDQHPELGWRAIDYKTSSSPTSPREAHMQKGTWVDLQLPLYTVLLRTLGIDVPGTQFAYMNLPPGPTKAGLALADWTEDEIAWAIEYAEELTGDVQSGALMETLREAVQG